MAIKEFIQLWVGKWFSLRSIYFLDTAKTENNQAEIIVEMLSDDLQELVELLPTQQIPTNAIVAGMKFSWDNSVDWDQPRQIGSNILVLIADRENSQKGTFLRKMGTEEIKTGSYVLAKDEALTLTIDNGAGYWQERIWYASDNLRLRQTLLKQGEDFKIAGFYSEIRKIQSLP